MGLGDGSADQPYKYYSRCEISDIDKVFEATEQQIEEGGQPWDMNPMIFYRVRRDVPDKTALPKLELNKCFNRFQQQTQQIRIVSMDKTVNPSLVKEAFTKVSQSTKDFIAEIESFTDEMD